MYNKQASSNGDASARSDNVATGSIKQTCKRCGRIRRWQQTGSFTALIVTALSVYLTVPAAQATSTFAAPENKAVDSNGVDMGSGILWRNDMLISIGDPKAGGIGWNYSGRNIEGQFDAKILYTASNPNNGIIASYTVSIGDSSQVYYQNCESVSCNSGQEHYNTLTKTASNWIYSTSDGTVYTFDVTAAASSVTTGSVGILGKLQSIKYPNGITYTIGYSGSVVNYVTSNTGFGLKFSSPHIYVVNTLAHSCDATLSCDAYDNYLTSGGFSATGLNGNTYAGVSITDALGNTSKYDVSTLPNADINATLDNYGLYFYSSPLGNQIAVIYDAYGRVTSLAKPTGTWTYSYSDSTFQLWQATVNHTVTGKDPSGATILTAVASKTNSSVSTSTDVLGRVTGYPKVTGYKTGSTSIYYWLPAGLNYPEGNSETYGFDSRGNVTSVTNTPKSGSGLSATSETASYPSTCSSLITCNKPTWTKDALGNQTDYTYDNTHGGVLTVTLPADQNGLRRRTYNTYTGFDTGNGVVYRLTRSETCGLSSSQLTLTACPALATTSVALTNYGTSTTAPYTYKSSQPYQVTQTDGASSLTATTTYTYDPIGNVTAVDGPRTDVDDKSYKTYDANRRVLYEIGVLPGGTGSPHRSIVHHVYDGDGHETRTDTGYANSNATDGSDFVVTSFKRMTYDTAGRLTKTEVVQP